MSEARAAVERYVAALAARDLTAAMEIYAPDAIWEVHVPGDDGLQEGPAEIAALLELWFTGRDGFTVARHRLVEQDDILALQWQLAWRDEADGAPCTSHQSHFFAVRDGLIQQHWLYCSGVRVYEREPEQDEAAVEAAS